MSGLLRINTSWAIFFLKIDFINKICYNINNPDFWRWMGYTIGACKGPFSFYKNFFPNIFTSS